jgi:hypothetical protein
MNGDFSVEVALFVYLSDLQDLQLLFLASIGVQYLLRIGCSFDPTLSSGGKLSGPLRALGLGWTVRVREGCF